MRRSRVAKAPSSLAQVPAAKPQAVSARAQMAPVWIRLRAVSPHHMGRAGSSTLFRPAASEVAAMPAMRQ